MKTSARLVFFAVLVALSSATAIAQTAPARPPNPPESVSAPAVTVLSPFEVNDEPDSSANPTA
jgi:hypothetical protein